MIVASTWTARLFSSETQYDRHAFNSSFSYDTIYAELDI